MKARGRPTDHPLRGKGVEATIWLGKEQKADLKALGGSAWVRKMIDAEKREPPEPDPLTAAINAWNR